MIRKDCIVLFIRHLIRECSGKRMEEFLHQHLRIPEDYQSKGVYIESLKKL